MRGWLAACGLGLGQHLEDAQFADRPAGRQREEAAAHVGQQELALVAQLADRSVLAMTGGGRPRRQRDRIHAGDARLAVEQFQVAEAVEVVEPGLACPRFTPGLMPGSGSKLNADQVVVLRQRPGAVEVALGPARRLRESRPRA